MRFRLAAGSIAAASVLCLALLPAACSSDDSVTVPPNEAGASSGGGSSGSSGSSSGSSGSSGTSSGDPMDAAMDTSKIPTSTDCSLIPLTNVGDVIPTFVVYHSPDVVPPAQTGGTLSGTYTVDAATVYLPSLVGALHGTASGKVNSWAVFKGSRYLLHLKTDITITAGTMSIPVASDVTSQGGYTVATEKLTLDYSCDTTKADAADYSFTDDGSGRATILVHTTTVYMGVNLDGYLLLSATKTP